MSDDPRCCGSGTCIIDGEGRCWCGQQWNGETMCQPPLVSAQAAESKVMAHEPSGRSPEPA